MSYVLLPTFVDAAVAAPPLPMSTPEREGISPERLKRLHAAAERLVREGMRSGVATMLVRNGRIADWQMCGYRDLEASLPMERDTIFTVISMTKVVTSVAALMLMEEGHFELNDPAGNYVPQLNRIRVFSGGTAEKPELIEPSRAITIKNLLTHTSGIGCAHIRMGGPEPVYAMYERADLVQAESIEEFVNRVAALPLLAHPNEEFHYGVSTDVLGYLIELVAGMPFDEFLARRIFEPLGMRDTHFRVPEEKRARLAKIYAPDDTGRLRATTGPEWKFLSGAEGLKTTIGDYARFAQMLLNGGELDGVRLLGRKTVELMLANHVSRPVPVFHEGDGFGLGGSVRVDLAKGGTLGSTGDFGWLGAANTWFRIDPKEKMAALVFMQHMPVDFDTMRRFSTLCYQTLSD